MIIWEKTLGMMKLDKKMNKKNQSEPTRVSMIDM
jgi:hypothetical protein